MLCSSGAFPWSGFILHSFEQHRLEMVSVHRILSLLPKPVLPSQGEDNYTWDFQEPANNPETTADEGDGFETTADEGDGFEYPSV